MFNHEVKAQRDALYPVVHHLLLWRVAREKFENTAYKADALKIVDSEMEHLNAAIEAAKPTIEKLRREQK
jgi:hypothetical protein